jgi:hypothetical protein
MELSSDFASFLQDIRPTPNQRQDLQTGHTTLRGRLRADEALVPLLVSDFLQGSYRRSTAVRPKGDKRADVDIIVVTKLDEAEYTPQQALELFIPFMEKYYKGRYRIQGRSIGIELSYVELDLVITSAPSKSEWGILQSDAVTTEDDLEAARDWRLHTSWVRLDNRLEKGVERKLAEAQQPEWKSQPLRIPDRNADRWEPTHPLEQIRWTRDRNARCAGHFVNVVKALKWWRLENYDAPEHPKGFPLERLIGECCPDDIGSVAEGITRTLEMIVTAYEYAVRVGSKPVLPDYGVLSHDVFKRVSVNDFAQFYAQTKPGAALARRALDCEDRVESGNLWRELLGTKFPKPPDHGGQQRGGFSTRESVTIPGSGRFA